MSSVKLPYRFETGPGHAVLVLEPGLNDVQWSEIERIGGEVLARVQETRPSALIIDLSGMQYMGSAMVALVVRVWKAMKESRGQMAVVNRHAETLEVLRLAGLTKVWTIVTSREEAESRLGIRESTGTAGAVESRPDRTATALLVAGIVLVLLAVAALVVAFTASPLLEANAALGGGSVLAAMALIAGTIASVAGSGNQRLVGMLIVATGFAVVVVGVMMLAGVDLGLPVPDPQPAVPPIE